MVSGVLFPRPEQSPQPSASTRSPSVFDRNLRPTTTNGDWARAAAAELLGFLTSKAEVDAILAPEGPQLSAAALHPLIWEGSARLWSDGHPRQAVQTAAQHLEAKLRGALSKPDVIGADFATAFSTKPPDEGWPRLRLPGFEEGGGVEVRSRGRRCAAERRVPICAELVFSPGGA